MTSFSFPDPAKRLNMNDALHWRARAGRVKAWRHAAYIYGLPAPVDHYAPSNVRVTFGVPDPARRRDPSNWMPTVKAIVDGLVDACYWPDDDSTWVTVVEPLFVKGSARTTVDIWPRDAA